MYQDSTSKHWYSAIIESLCSEPKCYKIIKRDDVVYRKKPVSSEAFYTSEQDVSIFQVCVFPGGIILPYVASENRVQEEVTNEQSYASTDKQN